MSDLKHQNISELRESKASCEKYIEHLRKEIDHYEQKLSDAKRNLGGQEVRHSWINNYIHQKTEVVMSVKDIERALGHKVRIKGE